MRVNLWLDFEIAPYEIGLCLEHVLHTYLFHSHAGLFPSQCRDESVHVKWETEDSQGSHVSYSTSCSPLSQACP